MRHARGYTIIEIMVAMLVGFLLLAAAAEIFRVTNGLFRRVQDHTLVQSQGQTGVNLFGEDLRQAAPGSITVNRKPDQTFCAISFRTEDANALGVGPAFTPFPFFTIYWLDDGPSVPPAPPGPANLWKRRTWTNLGPDFTTLPGPDPIALNVALTHAQLDSILLTPAPAANTRTLTANVVTAVFSLPNVPTPPSLLLPPPPPGPAITGPIEISISVVLKVVFQDPSTLETFTQDFIGEAAPRNRP